MGGIGSLLRGAVTWRRSIAGGALAAAAAGVYLAWAGISAPTTADRLAAEAAAASGPHGSPDPGAVAIAARTVLVYVSGAVSSPGLYRLAAGLRVVDALAAAGGVLADADPNRMPDLAGKLTDGKQVKVPFRGATSAASSRLDINVASLVELETIPGLDAATAQAIIDYRENFGGFLSLAELHTQLGLDPLTVSVLRQHLRVGG